LQDLHVDYSKPLNRQYKHEVKEFAKIHGNNFGQLITILYESHHELGTKMVIVDQLLMYNNTLTHQQLHHK
jgi:hypothetical protein